MAHLIIAKGDGAGRQVALKKVTCLGRGIDMDIRLDDLTASKRHARILSNERGEFFLEDLGSSNGTFLNEVQVSSTRTLKHGDEIRVGNSVFVFHKIKVEENADVSDSTLFDIEDDERTSTSVLSSVGVGYDTAGPTVGAETTAEELAAANFRLRTLIEIFQSIGAALDEDELLNKILEKLFEVFPETARGYIILRDPETGQLTPRAVKMAKPGASDEERLQISGTILELVIEKKEAVLTRDAMNDERFPQSQSIMDFEMRSVMCAPLMYEEEVLGFILLDTQRIATNYDQEGLALLAGIANQAALTIANARLHSRLVQRERLEQDLRNARRIQNSFLPKEPPQADGYQFVDWYGTALEVGGDFYDFVELPNGRVMVVVGDVSGKGITAALMMAKMASNVRFFAGGQTDPPTLLCKLNEVALASAEDMFVTVLLLLLDWQNHTIRLSNAGHCYPMVRRADGTVERVESATGFPVGITEEAEFPEAGIDVQPGEVICAFSDGIIEAMSESSELFGYKRLSRAMAEADPTPESVVKSIQKAIREHAGAASQSDDLTLVCFGRPQ
ncbi:MAG: SpoIIE family protein phosphatase [Candidatus Brocadiaceae bacterium]|nr:SpoIIE family protein phosphatase [Candidatus Brocadiaceae bacterium]